MRVGTRARLGEDSIFGLRSLCFVGQLPVLILRIDNGRIAKIRFKISIGLPFAQHLIFAAAVDAAYNISLL